MAENIVWNRKLLVASLILAVLAVALFYIYDWSQKSKYEGDTIRVLQWSHDLVSGTEISSADVVPREVPRRALGAVEGVLKDIEEDWSFLTDKVHVSRSVRKGHFVRYTDILEASIGTPAHGITSGMHSLTLEVDPNIMPGDLLHPGGHVNLRGTVRLKGGILKSCVLVQNLRVLAVGGVSERPEQTAVAKRARRHRSSVRVYRSITVEVSPELEDKLANLLLRLVGKLQVVVRNPTDTTVKFSGINPEVESVLREPPARKTGHIE